AIITRPSTRHRMCVPHALCGIGKASEHGTPGCLARGIARIAALLEHSPADLGVPFFAPEIARPLRLCPRIVFAPPRVLRTTPECGPDCRTVGIRIELLAVVVSVMQADVLRGWHALNVRRSVVSAVEIPVVTVRPRNVRVK